MISSRLFILSECENVKAVLDQTLRHDYGNSGRSSDFFNEISGRLETFRSRYTEENDVKSLTTASLIISELSSCLSLIERSHLGEFSWAFSEVFEDLAKPICTEKDPVTGQGKAPTFFISSKGGLKAYQIVCESEELLDIGESRILNIVFPHSLKHHVLLHAILGHEVCHAALEFSPALAKVKERLSKSLSISTGTLATTWYKSVSPDANLVSEDHLSNWKTEFLCDLFGLVLIGPGFAAALKALLSGVDPAGLGDEKSQRSHPPPLLRVRLLQQAIAVLGWDKLAYGEEAKTLAATSCFFDQLMSFPVGLAASNFTIISDADLEAVLADLHSHLQQFPDAPFETLNRSVVDHLYRDVSEGIPPSGGVMGQNKKLSNQKADFRLQILTGWMYWSVLAHDGDEADPAWLEKAGKEFLFINKLCERGMLQQRAITFALEAKTKTLPGK